MSKFAHVINTVTKDENEELFNIQTTTFNSFEKAKKYSANPGNISHYAINFEDTSSYLPAYFKQLPNLHRNSSTVFKHTQKKYPFLGDIITSLYKNTDADYIIYTNLDIALMPYFYDAVENYLAKGYDALVINRRRIPNKLKDENNLEALYAEAGKQHTGYDCFVIPRSLIPKFIFTDMCIGVPPAGNDLFYNIFTYAERPKLFTTKHLTFHIGLELYKAWGTPGLEKQNYAEFYRLLDLLLPNMQADKFPGADLPLFKRHYKWLMNPTFSYPHMFKLDMKRGFKKSAAQSDTGFSPDSKQRRLERNIGSVNFED